MREGACLPTNPGTTREVVNNYWLATTIEEKKTKRERK
jgi:hypothetical protein